MKNIIIISATLITLVLTTAFSPSKTTKKEIMKTITTTKSITVNTSLQEAFDMVKYLENFPKWSPFLAQDPEQQYEVKGSDGTVGAQYHWNGNKGKDIGHQEIVSITDGKAVNMQCDITSPFVAKPTFEYTFTEGANGVTITQNFNLDVKGSDYFFMKLFGAVKKIEKTNEQGMDLLKEVLNN